MFAPDHFQQATQQATRRRFRSRRERVAVWIMAVVTIALVGLAVYSLTNHQRTTGHGCIDFNYSTMIGGAETYKCGAKARTLSETPPSGKSIDTDHRRPPMSSSLPRTRAGSRLGFGFHSPFGADDLGHHRLHQLVHDKQPDSGLSTRATLNAPHRQAQRALPRCPQAAAIPQLPTP